jgi:hypothetical protein
MKRLNWHSLIEARHAQPRPPEAESNCRQIFPVNFGDVAYKDRLIFSPLFSSCMVFQEHRRNLRSVPQLPAQSHLPLDGFITPPSLS